MGLYKRKITVDDGEVTNAAHLTLRQSLIPCFLGMFIFDNRYVNKFSKLTFHDSHYPLLPLGLRIWSPRRPQPPLPDLVAHHALQSLRSLSRLFWGLLSLPNHHQRLDPS